MGAARRNEKKGERKRITSSFQFAIRCEPRQLGIQAARAWHGGHAGQLNLKKQLHYKH